MPPSTELTVVGSTLAGVTTAIVAFILLCFAFPGIIRHRPRFHGAFVAVMAIILIETMNLMVRGPSFQVVCGILVGLLQVTALVLLFMACSGLSFVQVTRELGRYYEAKYGEGPEQPAADPPAGPVIVVPPPPQPIAATPPLENTSRPLV
jgi:uncharacterized membrane protein